MISSISSKIIYIFIGVVHLNPRKKQIATLMICNGFPNTFQHHIFLLLKASSSSREFRSKLFRGYNIKRRAHVIFFIMDVTSTSSYHLDAEKRSHAPRYFEMISCVQPRA
mmetsp:Transcript_31817/g.74887  ORF Transcript_31817/g.74887 Transcript_31817/m.74887 type:complete len:110 (+) Transcript_31817:44-373(+)